MGDPQQWGESFQEDVWHFWTSELGRPTDYGFKVFYSPLRKNPELLIIGANPGANTNPETEGYVSEDWSQLRSRFEAGDFSVQEEHDYIEKDWNITEVFRDDIFPDQNEYLRDSVATNKTFFRSPTTNDLKKLLEESTYHAMDHFMDEKIKKLHEYINPEKTLIYGVTTYDDLKEVLGFRSARVKHRVDRRKSERLICVSESGDFIGINHPTGQNPLSESEFKKLRSYLHSFLGLD